MSRILVGVDGSKVAAAALSWAAGPAGPLDARLVVATAWVPSQIEMPPEFARAERDELARKLDDEWCGPARDAGVVFDAEVLDGEPPDALLDAADRTPCCWWSEPEAPAGSRGCVLAAWPTTSLIARPGHWR